MAHSQFIEAKLIGRVLDELGYVVDVVDYRVVVRTKLKYDLIFGFGESLENYFVKEYTQTKVILYSTGLHPYVQNHNTLMRFSEFVKKYGWPEEKLIRLTDKRWFRQLYLSDAVVTLGNEFSKKCFTQFYSKGLVYNVVAPWFDLSEVKEDVISKINLSKKGFLWFGGNGLVHKGLDLLLEAFTRLDYDLYVAGVDPSSPLLKGLVNNFSLKENIHFVGFLNIGSTEYINVVNNCSFVILPSASEGGSPALINVVGNSGLYPIYTEECSIDIPKRYRIELANTSILKAVQDVTQMSEEELIDSALENIDYLRYNYSNENFCQQIKKSINDTNLSAIS